MRRKHNSPVPGNEAASPVPADYTLTYAVTFRSDATVTVRATSVEEAMRLASLEVRAALDVAAVHPVMQRDGNIVKIVNGAAVLDEEGPKLVSYKRHHIGTQTQP